MVIQRRVHILVIQVICTSLYLELYGGQTLFHHLLDYMHIRVATLLRRPIKSYLSLLLLRSH
jgi:hypothetical protein